MCDYYYWLLLASCVPHIIHSSIECAQCFIIKLKRNSLPPKVYSLNQDKKNREGDEKGRTKEKAMCRESYGRLIQESREQ